MKQPIDIDFINDIPDDELYQFDNKAYWIAVIGSRTFTDEKVIYTNLKYLIDKLFEYKEIFQPADVIIISGKAKGVDSIARQFGIDHGLTTVNILPDWDKYKKQAGFKRNRNIIKHSDRVLAFRKDMSAGTTNGINHAIELGVPYHVIDI